VKNEIPPVIVMNMFYTGLGIARDLGTKGIPVIGLSSKRMTYGNVSRYCKVLIAPDSRDDQDDLLDFLVGLGRKQHRRPIIFPTRDHDIVFLMRNRRILEDYVMIPLSPNEALDKILNKWSLIGMAAECKMPCPRTYLAESYDELQAIGSELSFPCVVKPAYSFVWHTKGAWKTVGGRKAFKVQSMNQLSEEYKKISQVSVKVIIQEFVEGKDDDIYVLGSYFNSKSEPVASFTARKLIQSPAEFGTGCLVETFRIPEIQELGFSLLKHLGYHGISEVEFKRDSRDGQYKLIEINPRHWDWHRLGTIGGVNLSLVAYQDLTRSLPKESSRQAATGVKWIAEDGLALYCIGCMLKDRGRLKYALAALNGKKTFAIFCLKDPLPFIVLLLTFLPSIAIAAMKYLLRGKLRIPFWGKSVASVR
jgi:D-aspartate ligase